MRTAGRYFGGELPPTDGERDTPHERVQASREFVALRRRLRGFVFPATAAFLLWYLAFVLLASYARELMATPVLGSVNLGLLIGLAQFVTTFALTTAYVVYAGRHLDPRAALIRERLEAGPRAPSDTVSPGTVSSDTVSFGTVSFGTVSSETVSFGTVSSQTVSFDAAAPYAGTRPGGRR